MSGAGRHSSLRLRYAARWLIAKYIAPVFHEPTCDLLVDVGGFIITQFLQHLLRAPCGMEARVAADNRQPPPSKRCGSAVTRRGPPVRFSGCDRGTEQWCAFRTG